MTQVHRTSKSTPTSSAQTTTPTIDQLSNAALLTMAWFQVSGAGDGVSDRDHAFRRVLIDELHRRGVLNKPDLAHDSINVASLTEDDLDSFATMFEFEPDEPTFEESFVLATLAHDRFKERIQCAECCHDSSTIAEDEFYFVLNGEPHHPCCYAVGDSFDDLEGRTRWLLWLVTDAFHTFLTGYDAAQVPKLAAGFRPDLVRDLAPLLAEVAKIREQAAKLTPEETPALFAPVNSNSAVVQQ